MKNRGKMVRIGWVPYCKGKNPMHGFIMTKARILKKWSENDLQIEYGALAFPYVMVPLYARIP